LNGFLIGTNAALIALGSPHSLSTKIRSAIRAGPNVLSVVVYWEVVLKSMKGTLSIGDPRNWWRDALDQLAAVPLPIRAEHVARIWDLPPVHQDPFDRILVAQASAEGLALVTRDAVVQRYASGNVLIIS